MYYKKQIVNLGGHQELQRLTMVWEQLLVFSVMHIKYIHKKLSSGQTKCRYFWQYTYICDEPVIISPLILFFDMKFKFYSNICFSSKYQSWILCWVISQHKWQWGLYFDSNHKNYKVSAIEKAWPLTNKKVNLLSTCACYFKHGHNAYQRIEILLLSIDDR